MSWLSRLVVSKLLGRNKSSAPAVSQTIYYSTSQGVTTTPPEDPTSGAQSLITRFIRKNEVTFVGTSLCPDKVPNYFLDTDNINIYCQKGSKLYLSSADHAALFQSGSGVVNNTSNAFARVLFTSNNIIYLNQNYVTLKISPYGANTLSGSDYVLDDVIYQSNAAGTVTFQGRVQHFDSSNGVISILPETGTLDVSANAVGSVIRKVKGTVLTNVNSTVVGNLFPNGSSIRESTNTSNTGTIVNYEHSSGAFVSANGSNTLTIIAQANCAGAVGNTLYISSGSGFGAERTIVNVVGNNEIVLNSPLTGLTSNSRYTFGPHIIDNYGSVAGIFNIPESDTAKFKAGERLFTITDTPASTNTDYLMRATGTYKVTGAPEVIAPPVPVTTISNPIIRTVVTGRGWRRKSFDPVAQTFFVPGSDDVDNPNAQMVYGMFASSVDLFFSAKPIDAEDQLPVTVRIVEVENGIPTTTILAESTVECRNVKVSTIPDASNTSTITNFRFKDPVYLEPNGQYAIVVISDSPDYYVFISELGGDILGSSPPRRVSQQPYLGSFFKSQNASTWTPIQNQDLVFRINKAIFNKNSLGTVLFKPKNQYANINIDSLIIHTVETNYKPTETNYKFKSNNVLGQQDAVYTYVPINTPYEFGSDLNTSLKASNRRRVLVAGDSNSLNVGIDLNTSDSHVSPVINMERLSMVAFANKINDASIANTDITITSGGAHVNAANIIVTFSAPDDPAGVTANAYVHSLSGDDVNVIIVDEPGSGYYTTPTITFTEAAASSNATAVVSGETGSAGGNCKARYLTKRIDLADGFDAGDLRVYIDCIRPRGTNVLVYYKVKSASDQETFETKKWKLMEKVNDDFSKDQAELIEIEFRPNLLKNVLSYTENGVAYPLGGKFKYFAIKIVLVAADTTVVPVVTNMTAIATPSG